MPGIFISYRRIDSAGHAGRLFDHLSRHFGREQVFMDAEGGIARGADFPDVIEGAIASASAMVVVIGRQWLTCVDGDGARRLDHADDWVRNEVAAALKRDLLLLPALIDGATMPDAARLPDDIKRLARRQASELSGTRWDYDVAQLVTILETAVRPARSSSAAGGRRLVWGMAAAVMLASGVALYHYVAPPAARVDAKADAAPAAAVPAVAVPGPEAATVANAKAADVSDLRGTWQDEDGAVYKIVAREGGGYDMGRIKPPEAHPVYRVVTAKNRDVEIAIGVLPSGTQQAVANLQLSVDGNILAGLLKSTQVEDTPQNWVLRRQP